MQRKEWRCHDKRQAVLFYCLRWVNSFFNTHLMYSIMPYQNSLFGLAMRCFLFFSLLQLPILLIAQNLNPIGPFGQGIDLERVPHSQLTPEDVANGWISLFDGHSFLGWRPADHSGWQVQGDCLQCDQSVTAILRTASQFDNFEMRFEYASSSPFQVLLRTSPDPKPGDAVYVELPASAEFTRVEIRIDEQYLRVAVNGKVRTTAQETPVLRGYIGFSRLAGALSIRQLALRPIFDSGDGLFDVSDWLVSDRNVLNVRQEDESTFSIEGGSDYLESRREYANFIFQMRGWINEGGNSGVFFRCVPGENMNGYESQIDHQVQSSDKLLPANGGTGGVFRRKDARLVVGKDLTWFAKTIIAEGPHVAIWVNGYQVIDWTDQRRANKNPRRGRRTAAGTLMLQGHDSETVTRFRGIQARELNSRR